MRILVLNFEYPPVGGGGGRVSEVLARQLVARGHAVMVLTGWIAGAAKRETQGEVEIIRLNTGRRSAARASFASMLAYVLGAWASGVRLVRRFKPDVLHAHFAVPTGAAAWLVSRTTGVPYVLTVHLGDVPGGVPEKTSGWFRWVGRFTPPIWRGASAVVAVSEFTRNLALRHYDVPIRVIPNGVPLEGRARQAAPVGEPPVIIFVGRLQPQKDPLVAAAALERIADLRWTAVFVGDGPLRYELERHLERAGLGSRVRSTGWLTPEQADLEMAQADLLLMPSRAEGLPVVGVQALVHGLAIVGSRVGGLDELIVEGVNGYGLATGDVDGLAHALRACLTDRPHLGALKAASHSMADGYNVARTAEAYESVLAGAVRR